MTHVDDSKKIKTVSELVQLGYPRKLLYRIAHMPNSPAFRFTEKGQFCFDIDKLETFIKKNGVAT